MVGETEFEDLATLLKPSAAVYVLCVLLYWWKKWNLLIIVIGVDWVIFFRGCFLLFGWECGFSLQYYLLTISTLLFAHIPLRWRILLAVLPLVLALYLLTFAPIRPPIIELSLEVKRSLWAVNSLVFTLFTMFTVIHSLRLIIEEKARVQSLAESRTRLIANLSHEIKTPIAAMLTTLQSTLMREREPERYREAMAILERNTRGMGQLVQRMLDFVSVGETRMQPELQSVDISVLLQSCADLHCPLGVSRSIDIRLEGVVSITVETDPDLLAAMVNNLLVNAIDHSPEGGTVTLALELQSGEVPIISVRDQGPGIAAEELSRIFDPFYRADKARSREEGNVGLGLAIVLDYAGLLGISVDVESTPGLGARFLIILDQEKS